MPTDSRQCHNYKKANSPEACDAVPVPDVDGTAAVLGVASVSGIPCKLASAAAELRDPPGGARVTASAAIVANGATLAFEAVSMRIWRAGKRYGQC